MIPGFSMRSTIRKMQIRKSDVKYVCINVYKIKVLKMIRDTFQEQYFVSQNKQLKLKSLLRYVVLSATINNELPTKIQVLKGGISILEVYAIMKYINTNCLIFDGTRAVHYKLTDNCEVLIVFRFNAANNLDFCGTYENIYDIFPRINCV